MERGWSGILTDSQIDSGLATASVSFWEQSLSQGTPSDAAGVVLSFLNRLQFGHQHQLDSGRLFDRVVEECH